MRQFLRDVDPRTIEGPGLVLFVLCLTSLCARIDEQAIAVLVPQIRSDFGVDLAFIGTVASLAGILFTVIALPLGYLADRIRRVLDGAHRHAADGRTIAVTGLVGGPAAFAGARVANGLAQGIAPPASFPLTTDYFPPRSRARVFALYFAAAQLGIIVGPAIAGIAGDRIGWRATLLALGGIAFVAGLLTLLLREPVRGQQDRPDPDAPVPPAPSFPRPTAPPPASRRCAGSGTPHRSLARAASSPSSYCRSS